MSYTIEKNEVVAGVFVYTVKDNTGRKVGERVTRTGHYVGCLVKETNTSARVLPVWFRKYELVGLGLKISNKPGIKVAYRSFID